MTKDWDRVAGDYSTLMAEHGDWLHRHLIGPYIVERISSRERVLDLGCGEGWLARSLADKKCEVTALDASDQLLVEAERKATPATLIQADVSRPLKLTSRNFDVVVASMVLHCTENFEGVIENAWNGLRSGGRFIVIMPHPAFAPPAGRWAKTVWGKLLRLAPFKRVDSYALPFRSKYVINGLNSPVLVYHRPISMYMQSMLDQGFTLENLDELSPTSAQLIQTVQPQWRSRFPQVLAMTFRK